MKDTFWQNQMILDDNNGEFLLQELGQIASSFDICLHVDLCLGGFVLPFAQKLGYVWFDLVFHNFG